jgi:hypothetical protein
MEDVMHVHRGSLLALSFPLLLLFAAAACSSSSNKNGPIGDGEDLDQASMSIGPSGGTVTTAGGVDVSFPAGALPDATTVTVTETASATAFDGTKAVGAQYTLGPTGMSFAQPVTVILPVDPSLLPADYTIADVFVVRIDGTTVVALPGTVVDESHVSVETSNFSDVAPTVVVSPSEQTQASCGSQTDCHTQCAGEKPVIAACLCEAAFAAQSSGGSTSAVCSQIAPLASPGVQPFACAACEQALDASAPL